MKHLCRAVATSVVALVLSVGVVSTPAHADSSWGWGPAGRAFTSQR